jgi:LPS export ABC transporter protein LptC
MKQQLAIVWGAILALCMASCENNPQEITALTKKVVEVEEGKNIKGIFSQSANLKAYLTAPLMRRVKDTTLYVEFPESIHVDFYNENRQLQNVVKAKYARYFESMGKVFLRDSVVVYNMTGDTMYCKTLWWNQTEDLFYTEDSVYIKGYTRDLRGTGFRSKSDFSKYTIDNVFGPVEFTGIGSDSAQAPIDTAVTKPAATVSKPKVVAPQ